MRSATTKTRAATATNRPSIAAARPRSPRIVAPTAVAQAAPGLRVASQGRALSQAAWPPRTGARRFPSSGPIETRATTNTSAPMRSHPENRRRRMTPSATCSARSPRATRRARKTSDPTAATTPAARPGPRARIIPVAPTRAAAVASTGPRRAWSRRRRPWRTRSGIGCTRSRISRSTPWFPSPKRGPVTIRASGRSSASPKTRAKSGTGWWRVMSIPVTTAPAIPAPRTMATVPRASSAGIRRPRTREMDSKPSSPLRWRTVARSRRKRSRRMRRR